MARGPRATGGRTLDLVDFDGGIKIRGAPLWLDARRPVPFSFVSSAPVFARHQRVLMSSGTATLVAGKLGSSEALASPLGRPFSVGELSLELVAAGHVVGSAQLLVDWRGSRLLYVGGVRPGPAGVAEPFERREADVLVLDCPYDSTPFVFPSRSRVTADLLGWVSDALERGAAPLLLTEPLGGAQDLCRLLTAAGVPVRAHRQVARWNRLVRAAGVEPGSAPELRVPVDEGTAVVAPLSVASSASLGRLVPGAPRALVSGRAVLPAEWERYGADALFPFSSHADAKALRRLVRATGAGRVYLGPRHSAAFETSLRRIGLEVTRFTTTEPSSQLPLF